MNFPFKLEEAWEIVEQREREQEARDLAYPVHCEELQWPQLHRTNVPQNERYVDYVRREQARNRAERGEVLAPAHVRYGSLIEKIMADAL